MIAAYSMPIKTIKACWRGISWSVPMSRRGNCYDNAITESFHGTLKTEWVYHERYATREEARRSIFEFIEVFYNRQRRHSALGYQRPETFGGRLQLITSAAPTIRGEGQ